MQPLEMNQRVLTWLCILPPDETTAKWKKFSYVALTLTIIISMTCMILSSGFFLLRYLSIDLELALYAVYQITSTGTVLYASVILFYSRLQIPVIFTSLANIYRSNENTDSFRYLVRLNKQCEWLWRMYFKFMIISMMSLISMVLISVYFCYHLHGGFSSSYVPHITRVILPWNQETLPGYFSEILLNAFVGQAYALTNGSFLLLFISICWHHRVFLKMFERFVHQSDLPDISQNDVDKVESLCHLVRFHITVKEYFFDTAHIYSPYIMVHLIGNMIFLASVVFQLDLELKHIDFNILTLFVMGPIGLLNLFVYCFFGKLATESFENMADCLYEAKNWQNLPIKLQKHLVIMIGNMQRPIYYHGFGVAILNLETFCSLLNTVYSYYMIFKTLTTE